MKRPISAIVAAILVTGLALAGVGCSGPSEAGEHNRRGVELLDAGKWEEAIAELDLAIQLEPDYAIAYSNRAYGYSSLGQHERAVADCDRAIQLDPDYAGAYVNRGRAYSGLGQHEQARVDSDKAIKLDPNEVAAYINRGIAYSNLGQPEEARADYEKALTLTSDPDQTAQIQQALDRLTVAAWPSEWERGVCGALDAIAEEVQARGRAIAMMPPKGDYADADLEFEVAGGLADTAVALLEAVPSWPPGQLWVDNLMTQATGYRDFDNFMSASMFAASEEDLVAALALGTMAEESPTYAAAGEASRGLKQVLTSVYEETGFLCPT